MALFSSFMVICSILISASSHPVSILALILVQTLIICLMMFILLKTSWFSYILFLIFLGGLMVLFVYIVSLASNEKFSSNIKISSIMLLTGTSILTMMYFTTFFDKLQSIASSDFFNQTMMIFSDMLVYPTILIMFYLLYTLVVAVKVSSKLEGPLRNFVN